MSSSAGLLDKDKALASQPSSAHESGRWIFVTWYPYCRRSDALGAKLRAPSYLIHYLRFKDPRVAPVKYVLQAVKTCWVLLKERPKGVLVASPPVVAPLVVWFGSLIFRYKYVVDAHSGTFQHTRWSWSLPLQKFLARRASATLVTNEHMAEQVRGWGARAHLVQDLALNLNPHGPAATRGEFHVVFICTFSVDEPVDAVVEAARMLPDVAFSFTGDPSYAAREFKMQLPPNVHLTGFIPDDDYLALLRGADAILVLTKEDHTMQRGGYEAMALEKPLITSRWPLLQQVFSKGTVHVNNSAQEIVGAVQRIRDNPTLYRQSMAVLRSERASISEAQIEGLRHLCMNSVSWERSR